MLKIKINLLPWYNESSDTLDTDAQNFPKSALSKIINFGECKLEYIDKEEAHFISLGK